MTVYLLFPTVQDCTLDEILDEDDVLQELKVNNTKLTNL